MGINYDKEEIDDSNKKIKKELTLDQKINFIARCDIRKTKEELIAYRKELATMSLEEINLMYIKLNQAYWQRVEAAFNYRKSQKQRYIHDLDDQTEQEMQGPIL